MNHYLVTLSWLGHHTVTLDYRAPSSSAALRAALEDLEVNHPGVPASQISVHVRLATPQE